ncbi:MAG: hypothetical protein KatS3mg002_1475 [Candidatus Woesearchaeota archaeon]|nr:MAG: hypothetical protein KatS3mg002_1475 [Candidatus Woesearchaeota archaeon]
MSYMILILLLFGMVFTDLPIFPSKTVTHSLMFLIAPFVFILVLVIKKFKININGYFSIKIFTLYILATLFSSLIILTYTTIYLKGDINKYGINFLIKFFEGFFSLSFLHFLVLYNLIFVFERISMNALKKIIVSIFTFLTFIAFIEYINPEFLNAFHNFSKGYDRLRLLNMEPSHAGLNYFILFLLTLLLVKSFKLKLLLALSGFTVLVFIGSKGLFISIAFALFGTLLCNKRLIKDVKILFGLLFVFLLIVYINYSIILEAFIIDIEKFTSFSTRGSGFLGSVLTLFQYPLGTGYGTYIYFYPRLLEEGYIILNNMFTSIIGINLSRLEINEMIETGRNIGAKAGIPQAVVMNGWLAVIFFLFLFIYLYKTVKGLKVVNFISNNEEVILYFFIFVLIFQLLFGSEYTLLYSIWLPVALIEKMKKDAKKYEA